MGHRVHGHESKCAHLHGHNYVAEVEAVGVLDQVGRVVDFGVIKELVGGWIEEKWDHGTVLWHNDPLINHWRVGALVGHKYYSLGLNPTAENLAICLLNKANELLKDRGVVVRSIKIVETENCWAVAHV